MSIRNYVIGAAALGLGLAALVNSVQADINKAGLQIRCEDKVVIAQPMPDDIMVYFTGTVKMGTIQRIDTVVEYGNGKRVSITLPEDVSDMVKPFLVAKILYDENGCLKEYAAR